jgi:DNA-binding MarR family transcriptional regulator
MKEIKDKQNSSGVNSIGRQFSDETISMHEAIARKAGLTGTDHKYLGLLIQKGTMSAGELAKLTGLSTGSVTGLIDRFEKKNLATRGYDKTDRRKIIVVPNTENAMKLLGGIFSELQREMEHLIAQFTVKETKVIEKYMSGCIDVMRNFTEKLNSGK